MLGLAITTDAIRAIGLSKRFDGQQVLRQVDLKVAVGESIAMMGANGAGKTTLLRCLAGVTQPDAGQLWWHGETARRDPKLRHLLGMVTHESQLYPNLTLHENLLFAARMHATDQPRLQARKWLDQIGLSAYAKSLPRQVSHGMRRRVSVARGIIHHPRIILLDEPFSGLDGEGRVWLAELLRDLQKKKRSICFTTHDVKQAQFCADRVFFLQSGKLQEAFADEKPTIRLSFSHQQAA